MGISFSSHERGSDCKAYDYSTEQYDIENCPPEDITLPFLYKPHRVTIISIFLIVIFFCAFYFDDAKASIIDNMKISMYFMIFTIFVIGAIVFPSGPMYRPHPMIWRLVFSMTFSYLLFLIFLLFQNREDARAFFGYWYPDCGKLPIDKEYATHCELKWENIWPIINDRFILAHFFGWVAKALLFRDSVICWTISIQWEIIEKMFEHMLPNFAECWWDSWILDVLISNGLGIVVGMKICQKLEVKHHHWSGIMQFPTIAGKLNRSIQQFTPATFPQVLLVHITDLNAFFLKDILYIPSENILNLYRMIIIFFMCIPSIRQYYIFLTDSKSSRLGGQCFLFICVVITELIICIKFGRGKFTTPISTPMWYFWVISVPLYILWMVFMCIKITIRSKSKAKSS